MRTVIIIDVSLSMESVACIEESKPISRLNLAIHGINVLLDCIAVHSKLEGISLISFSSTYNVICNLTRDFNEIKTKLQELETCGYTNFENVLHFVNQFVFDKWGYTTPCQVILVTDGSPGRSQKFFQQSLKTLEQRDSTDMFPFPFSFRGNLNIMLIINSENPNLVQSMPLWTHMTKLVSSESAVYVPEYNLTRKTVESMFEKLAENNFPPFKGVIKCGRIDCEIILSPSPEPYTKITDFDCETRSISSIIEICGFLDVVKVGNLMSISCHLILPQLTEFPKLTNLNVSIIREQYFRFCLGLCEALKDEKMVALCLLANNWFGIISSIESEEKSYLMLAILEPGSEAVPWLGDLNSLGVEDEINKYTLSNKELPERKVIKEKNYWRRFSGKLDETSIKKHIYRILDKLTKNFTKEYYVEINRFRIRALYIGFVEILPGLAQILRKQITLLTEKENEKLQPHLSMCANFLEMPAAAIYENDIRIVLVLCEMLRKLTDFEKEHSILAL